MVANWLLFMTCNLIVEAFSLSRSFCFCFEVKSEYWNKPNLKKKFELASEEINKMLNIWILHVLNDKVEKEWFTHKKHIL